MGQLTQDSTHAYESRCVSLKLKIATTLTTIFSCWCHCNFIHSNSVPRSFYLFHFRDDAQNKMLALKDKAEKELMQYNVELKELVRVIDHDRKLRDFMSHKDKERTEAHEQMEFMKKKKEAEKSSEREKTVMVRKNGEGRREKEEEGKEKG